MNLITQYEIMIGGPEGLRDSCQCVIHPLCDNQLPSCTFAAVEEFVYHLLSAIPWERASFQCHDSPIQKV